MNAVKKQMKTPLIQQQKTKNKQQKIQKTNKSLDTNNLKNPNFDKEQEYSIAILSLGNNYAQIFQNTKNEGSSLYHQGRRKTGMPYGSDKRFWNKNDC